MRAKFKCTSVKVTEYSEEPSLQAEYSESPEDNQFSAATPWGALSMGITAKGARGYFVPGHSYYLDFTPVETPTDATGDTSSTGPVWTDL